MSERCCPELETLFQWIEEENPEADKHFSECEACAAIFEEHRQLEKDLLRLSDPLPPPDFIQQVMAKVEEHPVPVRREVWTGVGIFAAALAAVVALVATNTAMLGALGTWIASAVTEFKMTFVAAMSGLSALFTHAALPITAITCALLMFVLIAVRRVAGGPKEVRVTA